MNRPPRQGTAVEGDGVRFRVWAPGAATVAVVVEGREATFPLTKSTEGIFDGHIAGLGPGDRYRYHVDGRGPFPDPASRFQPEGVHGPSEVIDPDRFAWSDSAWTGILPGDLILYELHVGTFSPEGTFDGVARRLPWLAELGINAIELMPVNDFPGDRGWGYDGVDLYAPARCYGRPDDLRRLVDEAHRLGIAVLLDVVYNHLGPDGNCLTQFSDQYFSKVHRTPWGPAVNLDGPGSEHVRAFFIDNAVAWLREYHLDGLRLDATHNLVDDGPRHFLAELTAEVRAAVPDRPVHLIAEDWRNVAQMLEAPHRGGWGLDGVWVDDFHHELRRYLVGDDEGVFRDFRGRLDDLATTINGGWLFRGEFSIHRDCPRGTDPAGLSPRRFVYYIQNHDRIGNRAFGERLNQQVDGATFRAATVLLFAAPATPMLFMGQEWAADTPFLFFCDHKPELGDAIREGRRHEFRHYRAFIDPSNRDRIPDPQAFETFRACKLDWSEIDREPHAAMLRFYRTLIELRRREPVLRHGGCGSVEARAVGDDAIVVRRLADGEPPLIFVVRLKGSGAVAVDWLAGVPAAVVVLTTEDPGFSPDPVAAEFRRDGPVPSVHFSRPGAVVLRSAQLNPAARRGPTDDR